MKLSRPIAPDIAPPSAQVLNRVTVNPTAAKQEPLILLQAVSNPELGDIRIDDVLFAIGRDEAPFQSYAPQLVADLSRRHARIFAEYGGVYLADLDSKNGTTINGANVKHQISRLKDGDEICFGRALTYRVQLGKRMPTPQRTARVACMTLTPERGESGLQPITIAQFPFLISKTDDTFARYKEAQPHQVNYISRRHAHIFLKGGMPFVEDLGSTNGTFVNGRRLDEHAAALNDGDVLAFGGHHFVYKVTLQKEQEPDPTMTKLSPLAASLAAHADGNSDKTTFVASADSFLDIFCVDPAPRQDDEANSEVAQEAEQPAGDQRREKPRGKTAVFVSELANAFAGAERNGISRMLRWSIALVALVAVVSGAIYISGASQRNLRDMLDQGDYVEAAQQASRYLAHDPNNAQYRALGSEALLKAYVPAWLDQLKANDFRHANATLNMMKKMGSHNQDVLPLIGELEWIGNLEQFVNGRGGVEAPIRLYTDDAKIRSLLAHWNDDTQGHQRLLDTIASTVQQFKDPYAEVLSHVRKLQSDDAVYLPAIERLKAAISADLNDDHPEAIEAELKDYAEKYPRIGGMDSVRQDMRQYAAIDDALRTQNLGALNTQLEKAHLATPPFQAKLAAIKNSNRFPPANVLAQYQAVSRSWRAGDTQRAFDGLQKMASGPWADAAAKQLEQKKSIVEQFSALKNARGAKGYEDKLLSFYGSLDPDEDTYFMKAIEADMGQYKEKALGQARELLSHAQELWQQYQKNGRIEGEQRLGAISPLFRTQARLLTEANDSAQQGQRIYTQLKVDEPAEWRKAQDEIKAEADQQRAALLDARNVMEPALFKAKLGLLGGPDSKAEPEK
jgi:pSer/pThr/pTyr-binding forkhead associated (FHA) protein